MKQHPCSPQRLLAALSQHLNVDLHLENGVCALFDSQGLEVCVIELLPQNSAALLHCTVSTHRPAPDQDRQLLRLNFQPDLLNGCWLALDADDSVRLCAQCPAERLTPPDFCQWVCGFIQQVTDTRQLLTQPA